LSMTTLTVRLKTPHAEQQKFIDSPAKRKIIRSGRRSGKTTGIAIFAVQEFLKGRRILYATPTQEQVDRFWEEVKRALAEPINKKLFYKNETRHIIELSGTEQRIRAKTAWDADTMRGDYADLLIYDEWQLMKEEAWGKVGAPMLLDNDGDAVFIYTPPSIESAARSRARDPRHAAKMFKKAQQDTTGRWEAFHFTSHDNPHISKEALAEIVQDMTNLAYRQEILAEDVEDAPGALWRRTEMIEAHRVTTYPDLERVVVGVDPPGSVTGECGIVVAGIAMQDGEQHGYVIADCSLSGLPNEWGKAVVTAYNIYKADRVIVETNFGGDMVRNTIWNVPGGKQLAFKEAWASRGKIVRAEPVAAIYEQGRGHHVGTFATLEDELCTWEPGQGMKSPNRLDGLVWALSYLMVKPKGVLIG